MISYQYATRLFRADSVNKVFNALTKDFNEHSAHIENFPDLIRTTTDYSSPDYGKPMLEFSVLLEIDDPRDRLVYSKHIDIFNLVGLWIYLLSGSEALSPIEFYNPIARRFVDEETNPTLLRGSWGSRIVGSGALSQVISLLRRSPQTRRAVIPVFNTSDLSADSRNTPCLASIQFAVQGGVLNAYTTMRSQAAIGVLPYDLFLLTMLHEYVALQADVPLGRYTHFAPLCGVREREVPILQEIVASSTPHSDPMPPMGRLEPGQLALFHYCEGEVRRGHYPDEIALLPPYWKGFLYVSQARQEQRTKKGPARIAEATSTFPAPFLDRV